MGKSRRSLYRQYVFDVMCDLSQSDYWRQLLCDSEYDHKFLVNSDSEFKFSEYTRPPLLKHNLQFYASKVLECPEEFPVSSDPGCVIFKFEALEFPDIVKYSGNYFGEDGNIFDVTPPK